MRSRSLRSLQLAALATQRAAFDEIEHAKLAYGPTSAAGAAYSSMLSRRR